MPGAEGLAFHGCVCVGSLRGPSRPVYIQQESVWALKFLYTSELKLAFSHFPETSGDQEGEKKTNKIKQNKN